MATGICDTVDEVRLIIEPVDMRIGADGLAQKVQNTLGVSVADGRVYAFINRSATRLKVLVWDGNGIWVLQRRLYRGRFIWPQSDALIFEVQSTQWWALVSGIDWRRLTAFPPAHLRA